MPAARIYLLLLLGGCAVGPDFRRPEVAVNATWEEEDDDPAIDTQRPVETDWWKTFDDATLDRLVDLAHEQHFPLQIA